MIRKTVILGSTLVLLTAAISSAAAQDSVLGASSLDDRVANLEKSVKKIDEQIKVVYDNNVQIMQLQKDQDQTLRELKNQNSQLRQLVDAIAERDSNGSANIRWDNILSNSAKARADFQGAVESTVRSQGTLTIVNKMATDQDIIVEGMQYRVLAGSTLPVAVTSGTVSARLPGQEAKNWVVGPANKYNQVVHIEPRYTTYRVDSGSYSDSYGGAPVYQTYYQPYETYYQPSYSYSYSYPWYWNGYYYSW